MMNKWGRHQSQFVPDEDRSDEPPRDLSKCDSRVMYVEDKSDGLEGSASIGRVYFSKSGKTLYYRDRVFQSLKGSGYKANYYDIDNGDHFWISGPRKDQNDRLCGGFKGVSIDDDVKDDYYSWLAS